MRWKLGFFKDQFISNGYPVREVDRVFASYVPGGEEEEEEEEENKPIPFLLLLCLVSPKILPS